MGKSSTDLEANSKPTTWGEMPFIKIRPDHQLLLRGSISSSRPRPGLMESNESMPPPKSLARKELA